LGIPAKLRA